MIRRASPADAGAIAALWNPFIRDTAVTFNAFEKTPDEVAFMITERDMAGHATFLAEGSGLLGFASYAQFRGGSGYASCMEHTVLLAPGARGRGLGSALLTAVCDHARAAGAHQMIAGVSAENPEGVAFHARMGFTEVARIREAGRKFDRYIDLVLMQKFL